MTAILRSELNRLVTKAVCNSKHVLRISEAAAHVYVMCAMQACANKHAR